MAYSGLDTLFQNLGPATAGLAAGYREKEASDTQQLANLLEQERIREAQQKYQQSADKHPFTLEQLRLGNSKTEAEIPGIQADSSLKGTVATRAAAALQDNIDTDKYAAKTARLENIAKQHQQYEKVLSELGAHTAGIPAAAQPAAILSYLQSSGYDMEAPQIKNMLSRVATMKPEDIQKSFEAERQWVARHSPAFIQALETEKQQGANRLEVAKVQGQTQRDVAHINAESRRQLAQMKAAKTAESLTDMVLKGKLKIAELPAAFQLKADQATDEAERAYYLERAAQAAAFVLARPAAGKAGDVSTPEATGLPAKGVVNPYGAAPKVGTPENPIVLK